MFSAKRNRLVAAGICLGALVLLGILFHSFIQENLVRPIGLMMWLAYRVLLALDQRIYWSLLVFAAAGYLVIAMSRQPAPLEQRLSFSTNTALESLSVWRNSILLTRDEIDQLNALKRDLGLLLASVYAAGQPDRPRFEIYEGLKSRRIALPADVHRFLFPEEAARRSEPALESFSRRV